MVLHDQLLHLQEHNVVAKEELILRKILFDGFRPQGRLT